MDKLIALIENEIKQERCALENYAARKDYERAAAEQSFIGGLAYALVLAQARYVEIKAETNARVQ